MNHFSKYLRAAVAVVLVTGAAMQAQAAVLSTTFVSNNGNEGNMFNLTNLSGSAISLTGAFAGNFATGQSGTAQIWYRTGTYVGHETDRTGWTLLGMGAYTSLGSDVATSYNVGAPLVIGAGATFGMLMITSGQVEDINYTNGDSVFSDAVLQITAGVGLDFNDSGLLAGQAPINTGSFNASRTWNGSLEYDTLQSIPEPSTLGMMAIALLVGAGAMRQRKSALLRQGS